ncbi:MAG: sugar phosphate isomerase/epimerase [Clostridiaceae bacterium]|jgi:sugar phosphate isomerase/epimerase|nr:sugar phosphate isomerase/epimerase [Clostridiaceae bacterium]
MKNNDMINSNKIYDNKISNNIVLSVFTKPWRDLPLPELGKFVSDLGFTGIEFPLRPGYQVEPEDAEKGLPTLVKELDKYGIKVTSVAGDTTERVFAGCAEAGIPIIRIMPRVDIETGFFASIEKIRREIDGFYPLCEKYNIKVGIQHHFGDFLINSMEVYYLVEKYDPRYIGAIWDAAHSALAGEEPEIGLEIVESHLCMVNLKNIF